MIRKTSMKRKAIAILLGLSIFYPVITNAQTEFSESLSRKTYDAFNSDQFESFARSIDLGGNPMERFEKTRNGWVMCASTEAGKGRYLQYLLKNKFDVNFRQYDIAARVSTPLLCAINFGNIDAVKSLVAHGADPTLRHCQPCSTNADTSAVWMAIISSKYEIADWLYVNANLSSSKTSEIVKLIEMFPFPRSSPEYQYRENLIEKLLANGYEIKNKNR